MLASGLILLGPVFSARLSFAPYAVIVVIVAVAMVLLLSQLTPLNRGRIASPDCRYKASHQCGDFIRSRIQGKVAGVEYVHFGFGNVLAIAFRFTEIEG